MRRATLLAVLAAALCAAPAALAQGGPAQCTGPVQVNKAQTVGGMLLEPGAYDLTVEETGDLTCDEARQEFRAILLAPRAQLPDGWQFELPSHTFSRQDGSHAFSVSPVVAPVSSEGGFWDDIENWAVIWL